MGDFHLATEIFNLLRNIQVLCIKKKIFEMLIDCGSKM